MKSTRAELVIIQPLWPGPGPAIFEGAFVVELRAPLLTYASKSSRRSATERSGAGVAAAAGAAGAALVVASAAGLRRTDESSTDIRPREKISFFILIGFVYLGVVRLQLCLFLPCGCEWRLRCSKRTLC